MKIENIFLVNIEYYGIKELYQCDENKWFIKNFDTNIIEEIHEAKAFEYLDKNNDIKDINYKVVFVKCDKSPESGDIIRDKHSGNLSLLTTVHEHLSKIAEPFYMYILSNEEPTNGDYMISSNCGPDGIIHYDVSIKRVGIQYCCGSDELKVVASNNKEINVPLIDEFFIRKFILDYKIKIANVEVDQRMGLCDVCGAIQFLSYNRCHNFGGRCLGSVMPMVNIIEDNFSKFEDNSIFNLKDTDEKVTVDSKSKTVDITLELDYVSFELANLLKTLNFNVKCKHHYDINSKYKMGHNITEIEDLLDHTVIYVPTLELASTWFRRKHYINVIADFDNDLKKWYYHFRYIYDNNDLNIEDTQGEMIYNTYEEALDEGLIVLCKEINNKSWK